MTTLTPATAKKLKLPIMPSKTILVRPSGDRLPVTGEARITIRGEHRRRYLSSGGGSTEPSRETRNLEFGAAETVQPRHHSVWSHRHLPKAACRSPDHAWDLQNQSMGKCLSLLLIHAPNDSRWCKGAGQSRYHENA